MAKELEHNHAPAPAGEGGKMTDKGRGLIGEYGYLKGDPKDNHPERFPHNPEMDAISRLMFRRDELEAELQRLRDLMTTIADLERENRQLREALELTQDPAQMAAFTTDPRLQINPARAVDYFNKMFPEIKALAAPAGEEE